MTTSIIQQIQENFSYDRNSGEITSLKTKKLVGINDRYYHRVKFNNRLYYATQIIWAIEHGFIPEINVIDHIDGNGFNNVFSNLRQASRCQNSWNSKLSTRNKTGIKGLCYFYSKAGNKTYRAIIVANHKRFSVTRTVQHPAQEEMIISELSDWLKNKRSVLHREFARY